MWFIYHTFFFMATFTRMQHASGCRFWICRSRCGLQATSRGLEQAQLFPAAIWFFQHALRRWPPNLEVRLILRSWRQSVPLVGHGWFSISWVAGLNGIFLGWSDCYAYGAPRLTKALALELPSAFPRRCREAIEDLLEKANEPCREMGKYEWQKGKWINGNFIGFSWILREWLEMLRWSFFFADIYCNLLEKWTVVGRDLSVEFDRMNSAGAI